MSPSDLPAGLAVGRYVIERKLGAGGMGVVYVARHPELQHTRVAIKVLAARFAEDAQLMARFHGEAQAASRIGHPNIISVHDCGQLGDGRPYLVMELLDGEGLDSLLARSKGPLPGAIAAHLFDQICLGLSAAHQAGVIHRDLKPENVFVVRPRHASGDELYVKILDFGIAKPLDASATLTGTGEVLGTPHYMSPEQCRGQKVDQRSDVYALGVMLYECFTGERPFRGASGADLLVKHIIEEPRPPRELGLAAPALERLILDCMAKAPEARPASAAEVRARLRQALGGASSAAAPVELAVPVAVPAVERSAGYEPTQASGTSPTMPPATTSASNEPELAVPRTRTWLALPALAVGVAVIAVLALRGPPASSPGAGAGRPATAPSAAAATTPAPTVPPAPAASPSIPSAPPAAPAVARPAPPAAAPAWISPPKPGALVNKPGARQRSRAVARSAAGPDAGVAPERELTPAERMGLIPRMQVDTPRPQSGVR